jgi:hypothetical protein
MTGPLSASQSQLSRLELVGIPQVEPLHECEHINILVMVALKSLIFVKMFYKFFNVVVLFNL